MAKTTTKSQVTDEVKRAVQKQTAVLRAHFTLDTALRRIDYNFDVIQPAKKQIELDAAKGELPQFTVELPENNA